MGGGRDVAADGRGESEWDRALSSYPGWCYMGIPLVSHDTQACRGTRVTSKKEQEKKINENRGT